MQCLGRNTAKWKTPADQYMSGRAERRSKVRDPLLSATNAGNQRLHGQSHAPGEGCFNCIRAKFSCGLAALAQGCVGRMQAQDGPVMSGSTSPLSMSSHALSPLSSSPRLSSGVRHPRSQPSRSFWHALCNQLLHACCAFLCVPLTQLALTQMSCR